jgi:hypothetical protein
MLNSSTEITLSYSGNVFKKQQKLIKRNLVPLVICLDLIRLNVMLCTFRRVG